MNTDDKNGKNPIDNNNDQKKTASINSIVTHLKIFQHKQQQRDSLGCVLSIFVSLNNFFSVFLKHFFSLHSTGVIDEKHTNFVFKLKKNIEIFPNFF